MGTSVGWKSKQALIDYLLDRKGNTEYRALKHSVVGNNLWILIEEISTGVKSVTLAKMGYYRDAGPRGDDWGYKMIDETSGPCEVNCPKYLIAEASPTTGYGIEWRKRVAVYHEVKRATKAGKAKLSCGTEVTIYGNPYRIIDKYDPRKGGKRGWLVEDPAGKVYRAINGIKVAA